jgi:NAD(P)-dependent dehydrogenase (short-subunit alcohol dehydrogenase family)
MKIAIVTGGSSGIGRSVVQELAKKGIGVIFTYHSNKENADSLVQEVEQTSSAKAVALKLDLSDLASFDNFVQKVKITLKTACQRESFDYLVNNGGVGGAMMFADMTETYFDRIFDTNFKGPFFLTQRLVGLMEDGGRIVNTSSGAGRIAPPGYSAYGPSKAALSSWTRYLAKELAPRKICANAISPGPVHTNISGGAFDKHPEYIKPLADQTALGRIGRPRDVAGVIVGLLSDDFGWVTAQDIDVSGGFLL